MTRQRVITILTLLIVGVWIFTAVARIWRDVPQAVVLDSLMPCVAGYWFASSVNGHKT